MKTYPSIPNASLARIKPFDAHVFDKLDGQNIRVEYSRAKGWYKFGSRTQLIDASNPDFAPAIQCFEATLADPLTEIARSLKATKMMVFAEWWGPNSLGGRHRAGDPMKLTVFDATLDQRGWFDPMRFREVFSDRVETPTYLGRIRWDRDYVQSVRDGLVPCTGEGVVGKHLAGPLMVTAKAKTHTWLDAIRASYTPSEAESIINS